MLLKRWFSTLVLIWLFISVVFAQKEDRNWCFGHGAGINFNNLNNPTTFFTKTNNREVAASISDSTGDLLLYLGHSGYSSDTFSVFNAQNVYIDNGNGIKTYESCANCAVFVPIRDRAEYLLFHIGYQGEPQNCPFQWCLSLYYTRIISDSLGFRTSEKNIKLLDSVFIQEKISLIKHANGNDWWLLVREASTASCSNRFYFYRIASSGNIAFYSQQDIGSLDCVENVIGEMTFSKSGDKLAVVNFLEKRIDLFNFNRCLGVLNNHRVVDLVTSAQVPYGCEFSASEKFLYVSYGDVSPPFSLTQYNLEYTI